MEGILLFNDFKVSSYRGDYSVIFTPWKAELKKELSEGDVAIIDANIIKLYPSVMDCLSDNKTIVINPNETAKTYSAIGKTIEEVITSGFSKNNRLIAIGGGITQDVTSFAASILYRGVDWLFFPTNLATQADSCIGSKTSVNLGVYKNQLGGFHPSRKIVIDFEFCNTLEPIDICAGLGEMMHYFLVDGEIDPSSFIHTIEDAKVNKKTLASLVVKSLLIKKSMIEIDEFDTGPRNVFNYGHTFGHAIEAATDYEVPHGIAVAYGMDLANILSVKAGLIDMSLRNKIRPMLRTISEAKDLPIIDKAKYFEAMSRDKKNIGSETKVILTRGLGEMFKTTLVMDRETRYLISDFFQSKLYSVNL